MLPHHNRYDYSPIDERMPYAWPGQKRLAIYVCVAVEHFAFGQGMGEDFAVVNAPANDRSYAWRDYGQRIGLWRLIEMLDELNVPVAFAVNGVLPEMRPEIARRIRAHGGEIIAHGRTSSEPTGAMWRDDESHVVGRVTQALEAGFGQRPLGWASPGIVQGRETADILQEQGYRYVLDWPADDQPFWMKAGTGQLLSIPFPLETNDVTVVAHQHHGAREFADIVVNQFDELHGRSSGRPLVMPLMLHPYITGQPFRLRPLRKALEHCLSKRFEKAVWLTRPGEIAEYCHSLAPGTVP